MVKNNEYQKLEKIMPLILMARRDNLLRICDGSFFDTIRVLIDSGAKYKNYTRDGFLIETDEQKTSFIRQTIKLTTGK